MSDTLRQAYAEIHKKYEVLEKKPKLRDDLDEVTLKNPTLLLSEGYRQLSEQDNDK